MKPTQKEVDRRVAKAREWVAEQARRRGEPESVARQQGQQAAEVAFQQMRSR